MIKSSRKGRDNCPNCGAPIDGETCPYCGTRFVDFASMDTKEPFWVKVKTPRGVMVMKAVLREVELKNPIPETYTAFGDVTREIWFQPREVPELTMRMSVIPDGDILARMEEEECKK